ncbi:MAG: lipocalin family protein [Sphingobacteriales bacterium JAD_PAG50586_3]|nr:MAG: lipocalin family protein [Sphingobacteriales bacterium JAD_PAG50586_3]
MKRICLCIFLIVFTVAAKAQNTVQPVDSINLDKYLGQWYEVARTEDFFWQKNMVAVSVNYYERKGKKLKEILLSHKKTVDGKQFKLKHHIRFYDNPKFTDLLGLRQQVLFIYGDYQFSLVGLKNKKAIWIMARTKQIDSATFLRILDDAKALGYDISKVKLMPQP